MGKDNRQIRTADNNVLVGYKAKYNNSSGIAIMKGSDATECLGFITLEELQTIFKSGPFVYLEKCNIRC